MPTFTPPVVEDVPAVLPSTKGPARSLFRHYTWSRGRTVLKENGAYRTVDTPTTDEVNAAQIAYLGGHVYTVTSTEATALTAAGYGAWVT